jgi:amino acid adenylation domain-containing protein
MLDRLHKAILQNKENNAFCISDINYSYSELYSLIKQIVSLIKGYESKSDVIGLVVSNSIQTYASILACWFSGKAYVPINLQLPKDRNKTILKSAGVDLLLNSTGNDVHELDSDYIADIQNLQPDNDSGILEIADLSKKRLLYILFTSGSTGVPKGVPISCENLDAFIISFDALGLSITNTDKFLQMFEFTFDVSVTSFLVPLLYGASVYTVSSDGIKYISVLKILRDKRITIACLVPSIITYMKPYFDKIDLPEVKYCILTAEASNINDVLIWKRSIPKAEIYNLYGPTEATIWCTAYKLNEIAPKSYNDMMAIGKPLQEVKAVVLNEDGAILNTGEKGQLCIAGRQITSGYINNDKKNKDSFISIGNERFYKTGDLCYVDEEGDLFYCGRIDYQVKVNGYRIELGEIEATVRKVFSVNNIATLYRDKDGIDKICLFLESYNDIEAVGNTLKNELPYYMLPHLIKSVTSFPINNSNKVDRIALKDFIRE